MTKQSLSISGVGVLTSEGLGVDAQLERFLNPIEKKSFDDYCIKNFNPAPHLSDRKVIKSVSERDVFGLVAFEDCLKKSNISKSALDPERVGMFVGAPPSQTPDNHNYSDGVRETKTSDGKYIPSRFGSTYKSANPTTLLQGLPNNVLCYGSKTVDARGPNSNYTSLEISGLQALQGAFRVVQSQRVDMAFAGGYTSHTDDVFRESWSRHGLIKPRATCVELTTQSEGGLIPAQGAAFVTLESEQNRVSRQGHRLCALLNVSSGSDALWPHEVRSPEQSSLLREFLKRIVSESGYSWTDVALISLTGSGVGHQDQWETHAVHGLSDEFKHRPAAIYLSQQLGHLMEAGGLLDIGVIAWIYQRGEIPESLRLTDDRTGFDSGKRIAIVLRSTVNREYTAAVLKF